jgi:hypothetical protein
MNSKRKSQVESGGCEDIAASHLVIVSSNHAAERDAHHWTHKKSELTEI